MHAVVKSPGSGVERERKMCVQEKLWEGKRGIRERGIPGVLDRRVTGQRCREWEVEELFEGKLGRTGWAVREVQRGGRTDRWRLGNGKHGERRLG